MPQQIPLIPSEPFYSFTTTLDGTDYQFDVRWNARDGAWYFDLLTVEDEMIRAGNKIVLGASPGGLSADAEFPAGLFLVLDTSGDGRDATFDDMGTRVLMYFYTDAEINAL